MRDYTQNFEKWIDRLAYISYYIFKQFIWRVK